MYSWLIGNGSLTPVRSNELNARALQAQTFTAQWRPELAGVPAFRQFRHDSAAACLRGRRILLLGDSQTRDTFLQLTTMVGTSLHWWARSTGKLDGPLTPGPPTTLWRDGEWAPRTRVATMGALLSASHLSASQWLFWLIT